MPEPKDVRKQSLFLSGVATVLLATVAAVLRFLGGSGDVSVLHSFLPLAMACYMVAFAVGLMACRQTSVSRADGKWTPALLGSGVWAGAAIYLGFYGMLHTFLVFMLGV